MGELKNEHDEIHVGNEVFVPMITEDEIQKRCKELGEQLCCLLIV